jgi:hypothetical protein
MCAYGDRARLLQLLQDRMKQLLVAKSCSVFVVTVVGPRGQCGSVDLCKQAVLQSCVLKSGVLQSLIVMILS